MTTTARLFRLISILLFISSVYLLEEEECVSDGQTLYINSTYGEYPPLCDYKKYCTCIQCACPPLQMQSYFMDHTEILDDNITLILMDGEYLVNNFRLLCDNFRNITIKPQNKGNVIFRGKSVFDWSIFDFGISKGVKIKDLIFEDIELKISMIIANQAEENEIIIEKCFFKNNKVSFGLGEGLIVKSTGKVKMIDCEIYDHTIARTISNYGFVDDTLNGGLLNGVEVEILNCKFENNSIKGEYSMVDGGLIFSKNSITIKNSIFRNNKIEGNITSTYGMISSKFNGLIVNSIFSYNMINISIIDYNGVIIDDPSTLKELHYKVQGGVIKVMQKIEIQSCEFDSSLVIGSNYYGEFFASGAAVIAQFLFANSTLFSNNNIMIDYSNSSFISKYDMIGANAVGEGGAIAVSSSGNIENCLFKNNYVMLKSDWMVNEGKYLIFAQGGAIHSNNDLNITNSNFTNNFVSMVTNQKSIAPPSTISGGAISSMGLTSNNSFYHLNYAINFGGAIYLQSVFSSRNSLMENCQFEKNFVSGKGGGGGAISSTFIGDGSEFEYLSVLHSSFSQNSADYGNDIYLDNVIDNITPIGNSPIDLFIVPSLNPTPSPSPSLSSPSSSYLSNSDNDDNDDNNDNNNNDNTNWIVLVIFLTLFAFILTLLVIFLFTVLVCLILRERSKPHDYSPTVVHHFDDQNAVPMKEMKVKAL